MRNSILSFISLNTGEEHRSKVIENVTSNISFRGANIWILACAIVIACVGLNVNSTAVIIGAMLISPLMGPIVGAGFALGMHDFYLFKRSMKNLLIATVVSLSVAILYFSISPFKEVQSELLARTTPNIYDVMIAFFGGLVGVVAITRVEKGNPIPGVAIATALMPPLCTAGYGIAVGHYDYFFGAFYLYTINCFFICIATYLIVRYYLKYPMLQIPSPKQRLVIGSAILLLMIIMLVPSSYLAYRLLQEKKYTKKVELFIDREFLATGRTVIYKKINFYKNPKTIEIAFLNKVYTAAEWKEFNEKLKLYEIENSELVIKQDLREVNTNIIAESKIDQALLEQKDSTIQVLRERLQKLDVNAKNIIQESNVLFPSISGIQVGRLKVSGDSIRTSYPLLVLYKIEGKEQEKVAALFQEWLMVKTGEKVVLVKE